MVAENLPREVLVLAANKYLRVGSFQLVKRVLKFVLRGCDTQNHLPRPLNHQQPRRLTQAALKAYRVQI